MKQLYIAWTRYIRRPESMKHHFQYKLFFLAPAFDARALRPVNYLINSAKSLWHCLRLRPEIIWIQLAPAVLLYVVFLYKALLDSKVQIIADCHNSMFSPRWLRFPLALRLLNSCDIVLVHNDVVKDTAVNLNVDERRLMRLETRPAELDCESLESIYQPPPYRPPWILFPCSFDRDEPVSEVLSAAEKMPLVTIVVSGDTTRASGVHNLNNLPSNVRLIGFVSREEYDKLLCTADVVMGLTIRDDIQLSVANEAVGAGKPMVISDTKLLRSMFYKGAIFADPRDPAAIAGCCMKALKKKKELTKEVISLRSERIIRWTKQADSIYQRLNAEPSSCSDTPRGG
jgi:hypothetical protein